jgi:hypothetical protein
MSPDGERKSPPFADIATGDVSVVAALVEGLDGCPADVVVVVGLAGVDVVADRPFVIVLLGANVDAVTD